MDFQGHLIGFPISNYEEEEENKMLAEEDELESHFLVQALARTGKQRVVAMNLLRLWRILACLIINIGLFFALNFGAIDNITFNNTSGTPPPTTG